MRGRLRWAARVLPWCLVVSGCASPHVSSRLPTGLPPLGLGPGVSPGWTVVVDAGHGGHDPGTTHHGLREKDLTLDITRRLQTELTARGLSTVMTRDRDEFIALSRRPALANARAADVFVSVHVNANRNRRVSGIEVYYPRASVVTADASFPPSLEPDEIAIPTTTIKQITWDLVLARTRRASARVALHICRAVRTRLGVPCRGVHGARFVVLREARVPAVLIEVGYVSNQPEASRLASSSYRQAIAQGIADGLISYVRELGMEHL